MARLCDEGSLFGLEFAVEIDARLCFYKFLFKEVFFRLIIAHGMPHFVLIRTPQNIFLLD